MKRILLCAAIILAAGVAIPVTGRTAPLSCPPTPDSDVDIETLPHLQAALKPGGNVDILAIGTAAAAPGPNPASAVPGFVQLLGEALTAAFPGRHIAITPRGGRGQVAAAQLAIIRAALKQHHYAAVLWQTGTLEAVRGEPSEDFYQALSEGSDDIAAAGADLILVEPQYSRFLEANADLSPYLSVMQTMDAAPGTLLFHRYELMHDWEDSGAIDLEHAARSDRPAVAARLHGCLAAELARAIRAGTASR